MALTTREQQGLRLRYYRVAVRLTRTELAKRLGITLSTLRCWETGETNIRCELLPDVCSVLGVLPNDLIMPRRFDPVERMLAIVDMCRAAHADGAESARLGSWLRQVRKKRKLSYIRMGELAQVCPSDIARYEQHGCTASPDTLLRMFAALDIHYSPAKERWVS